MADRKIDPFEFREEPTIVFPELNVSAMFMDFRNKDFAKAYNLVPGFYIRISPVTQENLLDTGFVAGLLKNIREEINERLEKEAQEGGKKGSITLESEIFDIDSERNEVMFQVTQKGSALEAGEIIQ